MLRDLLSHLPLSIVRSCLRAMTNNYNLSPSTLNEAVDEVLRHATDVEHVVSKRCLDKDSLAAFLQRHNVPGFHKKPNKYRLVADVVAFIG